MGQLRLLQEARASGDGVLSEQRQAIISKRRITSFSLGYHWERWRGSGTHSNERVGIVCYVNRERSSQRRTYYPGRATLWRLIRMAWYFKFRGYPRLTIQCKEHGYRDVGQGAASDPASWERAGIDRSYAKYDDYYFTDFYLAKKAIEAAGGNIYENPPRQANEITNGWLDERVREWKDA